MLPSYLDTLPEDYKTLLKTPKHMSPTAMYYDELKKNEELKDKTRKSSILYTIFKEDLFTFMTSKGELNFNIRVINLEEYIQQVNDEIKTTIDRKLKFAEIARSPKEDKVSVPEFVMTEDKAGSKNATLSFNYESVYQALNTDDLYEVLDDLLKYCIDNDLGQIPINQTDKFRVCKLNVYMDKELRDIVDSSTEYLKRFTSTKLDVQNQMFLARSIKAKELYKSMRTIDWIQEFGKN